MKRKIFLLFLFFCAICISVGFSVHYSSGTEESAQAVSGRSIIVEGDEVEYLEKEQKIRATGNVSVVYGEIVLRCDSIEVDTKEQVAVCEGNVSIEHPDEGLLTGERIVYNLALEKGFITDGEVEAFPWFGHAREAERVSPKKYVLKDGFITTCDHDSPHYRLQASRVQIYPDDKVIARNVTMYLGKMPVMWLPYYYHPIIQSRSNIQIIPGQSSEWGYFLLSAWRFHLTDRTYVDLLADYRSKKGFAEGANLYYRMADLGLSGLGSGVFRSYFIHQNDIGTYSPSSFDYDDNDSPKLRQRFQWQHRADLDEDSRLVLELNKMSDQYVLKDYFYNEFERSGLVPDNYISFINTQPNYTLSVRSDMRLNDFNTVTQRLPEVQMDIHDQSLFGTPFFYSAKHTGTVFDKRYANDEEEPEQVSRLDTFNKLSYVAKVGFLQLVPFATFRNTLYTREADDSNVANRTTFGGGLNAHARFSRIYDVDGSFLGIQANQLRHLIAPQLKYEHRHQPTIRREKLYQMDEIDGIDKKNVVSLALENKIQTKRGEPDRKRVVDLVRFITSVDYHFSLEKDNLSFQDGGRFESLLFDLELRPYDWLYVDSRLEIDPRKEAVRKGHVETILTPTEALAMNLAYRYEKDYPFSQNQLTLNVDYQINPKWKVGLYERFDLENNKIEEQELSVTRDLHCWEVELSYNVKGSNFFKNDYTIWMAFKLKAFPDLQLGLSRSFSRRAPGAVTD